jgi:hypothetical protein
VRCGIGCGPPPARPPVWLPQCLLVGSRQAWIENRPKSFAFETNSSKPSRTCMNMFRCPVQQICLLFPRTVFTDGTMVQTKPASPCAALLGVLNWCGANSTVALSPDVTCGRTPYYCMKRVTGCRNFLLRGVRYSVAIDSDRV